MLPVQSFQSFITQYKLFNKSDKILLAVSGGKDSVLMTELFYALGVSFGIAHCNFNLRGEESLGDEEFTRNLALRLDVPFHLRVFDTTTYAREQKVSIQMAARDLRYSWFEEVRREFSYDYVALAHHQNDLAETVLLNLVRGTGIAGLHGILPKRDNLIRPLLFLTRSEIDELITNESIPYREDSSNSSTKYARNKIRWDVIPKLKELNPSLEDTFRDNSRRFAELEEVLFLRVEELRPALFQEYKTGSFMISVERLKSLKPLSLLLYELFKPFSFAEAVLNDLVSGWEGQPGRIFESPTHRIIVDRGSLLLSPVLEDQATSSSTVRKGEESVIWKNHQISIKEEMSENVIISNNNRRSYFDAELMVYPLTFRSWENGDYFYPLGMKGKKKVSDYFTNLKIPLTEKSDIPLLVNGNGEIMWICGYRADDRYKIIPQTKKVLIFEILS